MKKLTTFIIALSISAVLLAPITPVHAGPTVTTVTLDGILSTGEYTGGVSNGTIELLWYNDHHSIYNKAANTADNITNPMYWEINSTTGSDDYSLNIFFEVPTYARRMIWADDINYKQYDGNNYPNDDSWSIDEDYLEAYRLGSHHQGTVKMDYETQTGSELFELLDTDEEVLKTVYWQKEKNEDLNLDNNFTWETSLDYILDNDDVLGDTTMCLQYDMSASIEMQWIFGSKSVAEAYIESIGEMRLHLSDEARGLPPIAVPVPGAFLLGGIGVSLVGWMKRRRAL